MAGLVCEICGGKLIMQPEGIAKCEGCGMEYTKEYLQKIANNTKATAEAVIKPQPEPEIPAQPETPAQPERTENSADSFIKRALVSLEGGDFARADYFCEQALNIEPDNAEAYMGKLLAQCRLQKEEQLDFTNIRFEESINYQRIMQFGDDKAKTRLENHRLSRIYNYAENLVKAEQSEKSFKNAASLLKTIPGFKDADSLSEQYLENAELCRQNAIYSYALSQMSSNTVNGYSAAANAFKSIPDFKDSGELAAKCLENAELCRKDSVYSYAFSQMAYNTEEGFLSAIAAFNTIPGFKDADEQAVACGQKIAQLKVEAENRRKAKKKKRIKVSLILTSAVAVVTALVILSITYFIPLIRYKIAISKQNKGNLGGAKAMFYSLGDFKDSPERYRKILAKPKYVVYTYKDGDTSTSEYTYDKSGNLTKSVSTNEDGDIFITEYTYDKSGNVIKKVYTDYYGSKTTYEYTYDKSGNILKQTVNGKTFKEYTYDKSGNVIKEVYTDSNGDTRIYEYTYDKSGNLIKEVYTDYEGDKSTTEYTYDKSGNVIKIVYTDNHGDKTTIEYTYDKSGNLIKEIEKDYEGDKSTTEYTYDKSGNVIKEVYTNTDGDKTTTEYTYDKSGNLIKEIEKDYDGEKTTCEYSDFEYFMNNEKISFSSLSPKERITFFLNPKNRKYDY